MNYLTIKQDESLLSLAKLLGKPVDELTEHIINGLFRYDVLFNDRVFTGHKLSKNIDETGNRLLSVCIMVIGKANTRIRKLFGELVIWGVEDDCSECGCKLTIEASGGREIQFDIYTPPELINAIETVSCSNNKCIYN